MSEVRVVWAPLLRRLSRADWGLRGVLPAMVAGAVFGSLWDMMLWDDAYPMAKVGALAGPVALALLINALARADAARRAEAAAWVDAWRREETARRMAAARGRGELLRFEG